LAKALTNDDLSYLDRRIPITKFDIVDVSFLTANADVDIPHDLDPSEPETVRWIPLSWEFASAPATPPVIYKDSSNTKLPWQSTHVYLRSTVIGTCRLLLFLE
jgi:hypothetical protein